MDVWRSARHLCREPESRLSARRRRVAEHQASAGEALPDIGPNVQFPVGGLPWRNANTATPPGAGGSGQDPAKGMEIWRGSSPPYRELGVDARWEHCLIVVDATGQHHRRVDAVGQDVQAPARRLHQPVRPGEACLGRRRPHARDLQVHERRQAARADDRHAERARRRRDAFQPADVHGVAARRNLLRGRRLQRHARGEVRRERQVPAGFRHARRTRARRRGPGI